jgi:hypothetical protein
MKLTDLEIEMLLEAYFTSFHDVSNNPDIRTEIYTENQQDAAVSAMNKLYEEKSQRLIDNNNAD